ncbi:unnamed protein product [Enterobius vermicularis]|uniref:UBA domain-containing protein n=1 Tax=Enterobius vermicularis TaxID=51028 RepID=A0A0N4VFR8_ENTVE|nr:unnamed protein product [Enterobius vermicularis]
MSLKALHSFEIDLAALGASALTPLDVYRQILAMGFSEQQAQQQLALLTADPRVTVLLCALHG